ncbi:DEAD [Parasponia andersonii]|uniref:DEAD n=1 Tax=Parasponia andersonii TaxID=3476 RepID=A0A2P5BFG8_PARAD|nr:DEAD [Parasponia andersonii]
MGGFLAPPRGTAAELIPRIGQPKKVPRRKRTTSRLSCTSFDHEPKPFFSCSLCVMLCLHLVESKEILTFGLSFYKNLCVNTRVIAKENRDSVNAACRKLITTWFRVLATKNPSILTCVFFEQFKWAIPIAILPYGISTLQDLRAFGKEKGWCPTS